jgi:hypothetical protein
VKKNRVIDWDLVGYSGNGRKRDAGGELMEWWSFGVMMPDTANMISLMEESWM